ncbi:MAG: tail fiber domain-containing protein [Planctomycetota bacterium]
MNTKIFALLALTTPALAQALPRTLSNGTPANADDVMANFNDVNGKAIAARTTADQASTAADQAAAAAAQAMTASTTIADTLDEVLAFDGPAVGVLMTPAQLAAAHGLPISFGAGSVNGSFGVRPAPDLFQGTRLVSQSVVGAGEGAQHRFRGGNNRIDVGQDSGGNFVVQTNSDATRMTVLQNGNVGIGTTTPTDRLHVAGGALRVDSGQRLQFGSANENTDAIYFQRVAFASAGNQSGVDLYIGDDMTATGSEDFFRIRTTNGSGEDRFVFRTDGLAVKPGGGTWAAISDRRLKRDIEPLTGSLDHLLALRGHTFFYKQPGGLCPAGQQIGFVAQEVEQVFPQWVIERPDGTKAVTISGFEALAVEALRELDGRNEDLSKRNEALAADNAELRQRMASLEAMAERLADLEAAMQPLLAGKR